ncbi:hypothetical protein DPMN_083788 [Dreissena polymorpha]|uniref:Uncharacterized protein n=1 Tax=Dreissena polymorpha TaxID=45954 RepID=A0A9D4BI12_DREPO|nr:hypothetical protein DPMN_083788 [Dreissena polymorpha]
MEHKTNEYVRNMVAKLVGMQEPLLATINRRNLAWFGHVTRPFRGMSSSREKLDGHLERVDIKPFEEHIRPDRKMISVSSSLISQTAVRSGKEMMVMNAKTSI